VRAALKAVTPEPQAAVPAPPPSSVVAVRARAVAGTLLVLLAVNGLLPLLGHSPAGIWDSATASAADTSTSTPAAERKVAPGKP
jgi:hypothetical protein